MWGRAYATVTAGRMRGLNIIKAYYVENPQITATFYDTTSASKPRYIAKKSGDEQAGLVNNLIYLPLTALVTDEFNNPSPGVDVIFSVVEDATVKGVGTLDAGVKFVQKKTDAMGLASVYYTPGKKSGLNKVQASSAGLSPDKVIFTITGLPSYPYSMIKGTGDQQQMEMGKELLSPICVVVVDQYGNPTPSGVVNFIVSEGGGRIKEVQPVLSDAEGRACVSWILGPKPSSVTNRVDAVANLLGGTKIVTFTARGDNSNYPVLSVPQKIEKFEGELVEFMVRVNDDDGDNVTIVAQNLPLNAKFVSTGFNTAQFSWTPDNTVVSGGKPQEVITIRFEATDPRGGRDVDSTKVIIKNVGRPPIINSWTPLNLAQAYNLNDQNQIQFSVNASDPDGGNLYYSWYLNGQWITAGSTFSLSLNSLPQHNYNQVKVQVCNDAACQEVVWGVTPVLLKSFVANVSPFEGVLLEWETAMQVNSLGFNVLRSQSEKGEFVAVNQSLIPSQSGGKYTYRDQTVKSGQKYYYQLEEISTSGYKSQQGLVAAEIPIPKTYELAQNYPNPFNPSTTIHYQLPQVTRVRLEVYNITGQYVRTLVNDEIEPGYYSVLWDGCDDSGSKVGSGVYYYRFIAGKYTSTKKMALLK